MSEMLLFKPRYNLTQKEMIAILWRTAAVNECGKVGNPSILQDSRQDMDGAFPQSRTERYRGYADAKSSNAHNQL